MLLDRVMFPLDFLNVFITGKSGASCVPTLVLEPDQKAERYRGWMSQHMMVPRDPSKSKSNF